MLSTTVSGSFHRHMTEIEVAVERLHAADVQVLSPSDPKVVDQIGPFLFVASDRHRSIRLVQDRHLSAICASHFLWLVCPDGYVGQSASLEVGYAVARGIPIYAEHFPHDLTLRQYVYRVDSIAEAVQAVSHTEQSTPFLPSLLLDPASAICAAHQNLDAIGDLLQPRTMTHRYDPLVEVRRRQRRIGRMLSSGIADLSASNYFHSLDRK